MDRRSFLRVSALAGTVVVSGTAAAQAGPRTPDWAALARGLEGRLIRPGDSSYDQARRVFNTAYDAVRPAAVAYCKNPADVAECVSFARKFGVPVTSRSGGHSYAGWSTGPGLVIDVSPMSKVSYSGGHATVGAGARLVDVYSKLAAHGVSIPAGSCPTVGVAGLTLGGGIGVVSRKYGLTCDVLESAQIVTADGRLLTASATANPDLYWASRGGGGGNFGVATSFTFRTHTTRDVTVFFLHWSWAKAAAVLKAWQAWAPSAPDALWSNLHLNHDPSLDVMVGGLYVGGKAGCEALLQKLVDRVGAGPSSRFVKQSPYDHAMMVMAGCSSLSVAQCHRPGTLPGQNASGQLVRDSFSAKSHIAYTPLSAAGIKTLVAQVAAGGRHSVLLDALGGAVGRVRPDATAFPHRQALYTVQYYSHFAGAAAWTRAAHAAMRPFFGDHAYVNYIDPELKGWRQQYYGANAQRLAQVKAAYDPGRLFRLPQGV
ncbi:FAD-binding oxidoreductase [Planotetraspora sp. A-T 1434]|uniref:FAD-binding oxidoreductase n=1 Tax=Planotetraspora sp. A-T 1434 TaxID=2979219 RepID=UPI0021BFFC16|nr:FAD-binding oxidoreductase [Planotetraspora sp. A-T 1434]MCT9928877.1 FAD-binding oxidoreductase [Planotetraspora sp. A-T 1434]